MCITTEAKSHSQVFLIEHSFLRQFFFFMNNSTLVKKLVVYRLEGLEKKSNYYLIKLLG